MFRISENTMKNVTSSILNSYAQVFFSKNRTFAIVLIIVTFFDLYAGIAGLAAIIVANGTAMILGMNTKTIESGAYGFNALLVGLGIGIYYQPGFEFYLILVFISILTLMITISLEGIIGKYGLPYLSIPFLFGIWIVIIASKGYSALEISERGVYYLNDMFAIGGMKMVSLYEWFNNLNFPEPLRVYLKSLSAILFQYHMFAGILLAIGLVYYSRIAFMMTLIGFFAAYYFYLIIGANISELNYSYIGFNYILTAIALGGFFIIPSRSAVIWMLILTPLVAITLTSTSVLMANFGLSVFSLPFNLIVILFLYVLKFREKKVERITVVTQQLNSPELHAYTNYSYMKRFGSLPLYSMKLPFWGEWKVTQAHNGEITHKENWRHAWDFEIFDDIGNSFEGEGNKIENYYCFDKPVVSPADGVIEETVANIEDNAIGDIDIKNNWGNSVVIKHGEKLYSQLSHLKKESLLVVPGQVVKQGEIIGYCGNSGRSPYPHLHLQFQHNQAIGSKTIDYPFSSLIIRNETNYEFETISNPENGNLVSNIVSNKVLKNAYNFVPGNEIRFSTNSSGKMSSAAWSIDSDIYNNTFLICKKTGDKAWYNYIGDVFYFTYYQGSTKSMLYYFYLANFKVPLSYYKSMIINDSFPLNVFPNKLLLTLQDFAIPFHKFLNADYSIEYFKNENTINQNRITLKSSAKFGFGKTNVSKTNFTIIAGESGIEEFVIDNIIDSIVAIREF
jgi:urea transporter